MMNDFGNNLLSVLQLLLLPQQPEKPNVCVRTWDLPAAIVLGAGVGLQ